MATILIFDQQSDLPLDCSDLPDAVHYMLKFYRRTAQELSFHFVACSEMTQLHRKYFNDDAPTDCIGFPIALGASLLGDIFICPSTAISYAKEHDLDPHNEVMRYIVHALLHFFGFEDLTDRAAAAMRFQEDLTLLNLSRRGYALCPT